MDKTRPAGITVLSVLAILFGLFGLYGSFLLILKYKELMNTQPNALTLWSLFALWGLVSAPVFSILLIISGTGLLRLKNYGKNLLIALSVYVLLTRIMGTILGIPFNIASILQILPYAFIIYYLTRPKIKEMFR